MLTGGIGAAEFTGEKYLHLFVLMLKDSETPEELKLASNHATPYVSMVHFFFALNSKSSSLLVRYAVVLSKTRTWQGEEPSFSVTRFRVIHIFHSVPGSIYSSR